MRKISINERENNFLEQLFFYYEEFQLLKLIFSDLIKIREIKLNPETGKEFCFKKLKMSTPVKMSKFVEHIVDAFAWL